MNILNITFNGINAERKSVPKGSISVSNNIKIEGVEEVKMGLDKTKIALKFLFSYKTSYSPDIALIELKGELLSLVDAEESVKVLEKWKNDKSLDKDTAKVIINNVMNKCTIEVILLSRELGLPSPIPMPSVKDDSGSKPAKK
jgi:hypothetical protein